MLTDFFKLSEIILFLKFFIKIMISVGDPLVSCGNHKIEQV
jgi:hypothetical protein